MNEKRLTPRLKYILAAISGVLILLSLPPFMSGGFLGWFMFVPLLIAVYYETDVKILTRLVTISGLGGFLLSIWIGWWILDLIRLVGWQYPPIWFQVIIIIFGFVVAFFCGKIFYGNVVKVWWKPKKLPTRAKILQHLPATMTIIGLPLIYTAIEFLFMTLPGIVRITGIFGFCSMSKTQWLNSPILQVASVTGMYGITFLVLLVNCLTAYVIIHYKETKQFFKPILLVITILPLIYVIGWTNVPQKAEGDVTIAVLQKPPSGQNTTDDYMNLCNESLKYNPQIIILPALVFDGLMLGEEFINFSRDNNVYLMGFVGFEDFYGIITPNGSVESDNFGYHIATIPHNFMNGDILGLFFPTVHSLNTDIGSFGVTDCYESGPPIATRERVRAGAQLLIIPTGGPNAHIFSWSLKTNAILRAVEHKMYAVEVIGDYESSFIIDPYGRVISDIALEPEIVVGKISFNNERTFYSLYGDVFGWIIVGLTLILIAYNSYLKKESEFKYCSYCRAKLGKDVMTCEECGESQIKPPLWKRIVYHEYYEHKKM